MKLSNFLLLILLSGGSLFACSRQSDERRENESERSDAISLYPLSRQESKSEDVEIKGIEIRFNDVLDQLRDQNESNKTLSGELLDELQAVIMGYPPHERAALYVRLPFWLLPHYEKDIMQVANSIADQVRTKGSQQTSGPYHSMLNMLGRSQFPEAASFLLDEILEMPIDPNNIQFSQYMEYMFHGAQGRAAKAFVGNPCSEFLMEDYYNELHNAGSRRKWAMIWALEQESRRIEDFDFLATIRSEHLNNSELLGAIDRAMNGIYRNMVGRSKLDVDAPVGLVVLPVDRDRRIEMVNEMSEQAIDVRKRLREMEILEWDYHENHSG